jgi:hypothetical protein
MAKKERDLVAPIVYELSIKGYSITQIQDHLRENNLRVYSGGSIKLILQKFREINVPEINLVEEKKRILLTLTDIQRRALKEFELSKRERKEKYIKKRQIPRKPQQAGRASDDLFVTQNSLFDTVDETYIKTVEQTGDARYLKVALDSLKQQTDLLGLSNENLPSDDKIVWEEIKTYESDIETLQKIDEMHEQLKKIDLSNNETEQETD